VTSERKIRANRANARASTGPKTAQGRLHARRNALRHALSLPVSSDPAFSEDVEALARQLIGTNASAEIKELARRIAETQIDLRRVRLARHQLFSQALGDPDPESEGMPRTTSVLVWPDNVVEFLRPTPDGSSKFATILADRTRRLLALDRYERRALSRRKFAIRAFDAARHSCQ
jgi:hypothetical protein